MNQHPLIEPSGRTRVLEVRRGIRHWEVKSLEANESAWRTTMIPLDVHEVSAVPAIVLDFFGNTPNVEKVTVMVRTEPTRGILT
jgi:hypothetical protein